jgi:hypothetical protein
MSRIHLPTFFFLSFFLMPLCQLTSWRCSSYVCLYILCREQLGEKTEPVNLLYHHHIQYICTSNMSMQLVKSWSIWWVLMLCRKEGRRSMKSWSTMRHHAWLLKLSMRDDELHAIGESRRSTAAAKGMHDRSVSKARQWGSYAMHIGRMMLPVKRPTDPVITCDDTAVYWPAGTVKISHTTHATFAPLITYYMPCRAVPCRAFHPWIHPCTPPPLLLASENAGKTVHHPTHT